MSAAPQDPGPPRPQRLGEPQMRGPVREEHDPADRPPIPRRLRVAVGTVKGGVITIRDGRGSAGEGE
jgi:hypothetical protein